MRSRSVASTTARSATSTCSMPSATGTNHGSTTSAPTASGSSASPLPSRRSAAATPTKGARTMKLKKTILAASIAAIALGGAAFALSGKASHPAEKKPSAASITVNLVAPESSTFARAIAATGTVSARDELLIGSDANGVRLMEVLVDVGSLVQKGQLLARGDDSQLVIQVAQQEAMLKQAQADLAQVQSNLDRAEKLTDDFSVEIIQTRRTSAATAAAKLELAVAQRDELRVKIAHTR